MRPPPALLKLAITVLMIGDAFTAAKLIAGEAMFWEIERCAADTILIGFAKVSSKASN